MKRESERILFSATDLANHLGCTHLTTLERQVADGLLTREYRHDPMLELLIELGEAHEEAYLNSLRADGKSVVEIEGLGGQSAATQTLEAMRQGVDVIAQAWLISLPWRGRADFLMKVDEPSRFGAWSYEVIDTKLSQTIRASAVLQLCLYAEIVAEIQGTSPKRMHVVKPGDPFEIDTLRVDDYMAYYRMAKVRFESFLANGPHADSYPHPNAHCEICSWWPRCNETWRNDDHLTFVAGISKSQISELQSQGIDTLEAFAISAVALPAPPKRGSLEAFAKSHRQAQVQLAGRRSGLPEYEFHDVEEGRGFLLLPEPDAGDVFFDIEGNPRAIGDGLEYLFGYAVSESDSLQYHRLWALSKREERELFERFIDDMMQRWSLHPKMHIYHYAPYEPSALKRLATRHATREDELDQLLRSERLVDLYAVVRQGIRASVESYSIKQLERFYGYERLEVLEQASKALREVERLIELDLTKNVTSEHRQVVETYNMDDCLSTAALRDWLESLRSELESTGQALIRPEEKSGDPGEAAQQQSSETQRVFDQLITDIGDEPSGEDQCSRWLLAHMLDYFRRESKCAWWEYFRMHELEHDELLRERKAISGLRFKEALPASSRSPTAIHRYEFDPQEATVEVGDGLVEVAGGRIGSVAAIDCENWTLDIRKRTDTEALHPNAVFAFEWFSPDPMPSSLLDLGKKMVLGGTTNNARYDLLAKHSPRLQSLALPLDGDPKEVATKLAFDLDNSVLPIQGPPGAGKTFVGSHMIVALARARKRIGVTAVSHKVILNLLSSVREQSKIGKGVVRLGHQSASKSDEIPGFVRRLGKTSDSLIALDSGYVVGGTAWLWSNPRVENKLDYLFIDEAGQMSLAMALAAGRAAKNIVLLGDPQQLEQPQQGAHPEGADIAALSHLLDGAETMPPDKGLFLEHTWRLHPKICDFTSEQYYDRRLKSKEGLELQEVVGDSSFTGSGLRFIPVVHKDNQNRSSEEVEAIAEIVAKLADGNHCWVNKDGESSTIGLPDILIVAPFNAQVNAVKSALPDGAQVGTVDKFQGQEAPVVIYSMTSSSADDAPRGMEFLFSQNRMNVATSRARCLVLLVGSPLLSQMSSSSRLTSICPQR